MVRSTPLVDADSSSAMGLAETQFEKSAPADPRPLLSSAFFLIEFGEEGYCCRKGAIVAPSPELYLSEEDAGTWMVVMHY